jgi:hypothetical protein
MCLRQDPRQLDAITITRCLSYHLLFDPAALKAGIGMVHGFEF